MSLDPVIGVDFSGAKQDANTWMASGVLRSDGLQVNDIRSVTRDELLALLRAGPGGSRGFRGLPLLCSSTLRQRVGRLSKQHG